MSEATAISSPSLVETQHAASSGWAMTTFAEIASDAVEQTGPSGSGEFTYVDISSIDKETKRITEPQVLPKAQAPSRAKQRLRQGDVLVSMTRPNLNAVTLVKSDFEASIGSTGFCVLRATFVNPSFLFYRVQATDFIRSMCSVVQGALYPAVRPKDVFSFSVDLPPRSEQDRIVAEIEKQFTRLDDAVAALKRVQANLKRYRASVLKAACEGRLVPTEAELARKEGRDYEPASELLKRILAERRAKWEANQLAKMKAAGKPTKDGEWKKKYKEPEPPDTGKLPELPEGWAWATLDQVSTTVRNGISTKPDSESGLPILRISAVRPFLVDLEDLRFLPKNFDSSGFTLIEDDLLFTRYNGNREYVGVCGRVRNLSGTVVHPDKLIKVTPVMRGDFAKWLELMSNVGPSREFLAKRIRTTAGQSGISGEDLKSLPVPLAPELEAARITSRTVEELDRIRTLSDALATQTRRSSNLRVSVLTKAFSGKLVPQDPNDEPASALLERIRAERAQQGIGKPARKPRTRREKAMALEA